MEWLSLFSEKQYKTKGKKIKMLSAEIFNVTLCMECQSLFRRKIIYCFQNVVCSNLHPACKALINLKECFLFLFFFLR